MGRRTQQRRRRRVEELIALRHDERELRRRWLARVDAWCKGISGSGEGRRIREVVESVLRELADIGVSMESPLAAETRHRLEAACGRGSSDSDSGCQAPSPRDGQIG